MSVYRQRFRVSRRIHKCIDCGQLIGIGDRYLAYSASPGSEFNDGPKWANYAFCGPCSEGATEYPPRNYQGEATA